MFCCNCDKEIDPRRVAAIPNVKLCFMCSRKVGTKRVKGVNVFYCKTSPDLQVVTEDYYNTEWKKYNPSFGRGSGVHAMSPRSAGTK